MFTQITSLVIPTRNRHIYLNNTLLKLKKLNLKFHEVLVIDSSDNYKKEIIEICKDFNAKLFFTQPSSALQRNFGLNNISNKSKYVMFLDDDIIFLKNSFSKMNEVIKKMSKSDKHIAGFGFNQIDASKSDFLTLLKKSFFSKKFNLYSDADGKVMKNGWHTKINNLKKDKFVQWLHTAATIYELKKINKIKFDEELGEYSYLEDLDFSYRVNCRFKLLLVAGAKFLHRNNIARNSFAFGKLEIQNRYRFVKKNNLNIKLFYISSLIRFIISLSGIIKFNFKLVLRSVGNLAGISKCLIA